MVISINKKIDSNEEQIINSKLSENDYLVKFDDYTMIKCQQKIEIKLDCEINYFEDENELVFVNKKYKNKKTVITINDNKIGEEIAIIGGPCSIEDENSLEETIKFMNSQEINLIRGGLSKPRTSVYSFQGLDDKAFGFIKKLKEQYNFVFVSEIVSINQIDKYSEVVDVFQIGTRNMQNYELLKAVGKSNKPVILKRGFSATLNEFLNSAEYIIANGNSNVILCERGIRTFETSYRNTLDLNAVVYLKEKTHLPVIVDPSHASGHWWMVEKLALSSIVAGADGLLIEVHNNPEMAISDGEQSINFDNFSKLLKKVELIKNVNL